MKCDNCNKKISVWESSYSIGDSHVCKDCYESRHNNPSKDKERGVKWFYAIENEQNGPVSEERLINLIKQTDLQKSDLVWKKGMNDWQVISEVSEFKEHFDEETPPPLPKKNEKKSISEKSEVKRPKKEEPIEQKCWDCKYYSYKKGFFSDPSSGKCEFHNKKTLASDSCEQFVGKSEENKSKKTTETEIESDTEDQKSINEKPELTNRWLKFYVYFRIPFGIFILLINAFSPPTYLLYSEIGIFRIVLTCFIIAYLVLFWALFKRKLWGWKYNWGFIFLEPIIFSFGASKEPSQFVLFLFGSLLIYSLPNYIYFKKRKHLFN